MEPFVGANELAPSSPAPLLGGVKNADTCWLDTNNNSVRAAIVPFMVYVLIDRVCATFSQLLQSSTT